MVQRANPVSLLRHWPSSRLTILPDVNCQCRISGGSERVLFPIFRRLVSFACIILTLAAFWFSAVVMAPTVRAAVLYDSGDPTPSEQLVLEYINRARSNPVAEGTRLGIDIHEGLSDPSLVGPRPPLAMNRILLSIATAHSDDMYNQNYFSHTDPNGNTPFDRMTNAGYNYVLAGENMAAGTGLSATQLEDLMMVDSGTPGRPHRVNLLDLINPYPCGYPPCVYSEVGIGYFGGAIPDGMGITSLITEDFGAASATPFLLGVVYNDRNSNSFYDIGEGIAGVTITTNAGGYYAVSSSSGGYAIPVGSSGSISVTASGPGFGPITKTVMLTGANVKLDFTTQVSQTTSFQSITKTSTLTTTSSKTTSQTLLQSVAFQSTPSSFAGATTSGTITACGGTYTYTQSASSCGSSFTATANLPAPSVGWQFDHWSWTRGVTCSSNFANPVSCSDSSAGGSLMAVYGAQVTFVTSPASPALMSWGSCSNPSKGNGASFFSTSYGSNAIAACYVPSGYTVSYWSCSGGLYCSGSNNPIVATFVGPGTITLNLRAQTQVASSTSTTSSALSSTASTLLSVTSSSSSTSTSSITTSSTHSTPEFGIGQIVMVGSILAVLVILIRRNDSRKH